MRARSPLVPSLVALALLGAAPLFFHAPMRQARAASPQPTAGRTIVVEGEARGSADLDAYLTVLIRGDGATAAQAEAAVRAKATGVKAKEAQRPTVIAGPVFLAPSEGSAKGFVATETLRLALKDAASAGEVADRALAAGATRASGVLYAPRPLDGAHLHALVTLAVQDARTNATSAAQALGVHLGSPVKVEVVSEGARPNPGGGLGYGVTVRVTFAF